MSNIGLFTQVVHPLELLHDGHGARGLHRDDHPDGVTEEVARGLQESLA